MATKHVHALWINMREEPMVYINGTPFVLREEVRGGYNSGKPFVLPEEMRGGRVERSWVFLRGRRSTP